MLDFFSLFKFLTSYLIFSFSTSLFSFATYYSSCPLPFIALMRFFSKPRFAKAASFHVCSYTYISREIWERIVEEHSIHNSLLFIL